MNDEIKIACPKCGTQISIDKALEERMQGKYKKEFDDRLSSEKDKLEKEIKIKASKYYADESIKLKQELEEKDKSLAQFREQELLLRKEKLSLEEQKKNFEIEFQRKIDKERQEIQAATQKTIEEQNQWKVAEKEKVINDLKKQMEEMKRKVEQGSQQTQGEVAELELENILKTTFPFDEIKPVGKGVNGADVVQVVRDHMGKVCGKIIWESKNTKAFSAGWVPKLKEDLRSEKADVAVLISYVVPDDIKTFGYLNGIWVTKFEFVLGLATALRANLVEVTKIKLSVVNKNDKMEFLYTYLTGNEFKHRVISIAEAFTTLQDDLSKEKRVYEKIWSKREKLLSQVTTNTFGMYGDLQGLIGPTLQEIKQLSIDEDELEELVEKVENINNPEVGSSDTLF